jgi:hypothetical protein
MECVLCAAAAEDVMMPVSGKVTRQHAQDRRAGHTSTQQHQAVYAGNVHLAAAEGVMCNACIASQGQDQQAQAQNQMPAVAAAASYTHLNGVCIASTQHKKMTGRRPHQQHA